MSLLGDLFGSSSHTQTTQSTSNVTNTQLAGGSVDAPVAYGTGNVQTTNVITNTIDPGAIALARSTSALGIAAGADIAARGLQSGVATAYDISQAAIQLGAGSNAVASGVANAALNFGSTAVGAVSRSNDTIAKFSGAALDTLSSAFTSVLGSQATLTDQNLQAVSGLASQVSQSATQSVNDSLTKMVTIISIAAAAIFIFRGMK